MISLQETKMFNSKNFEAALVEDMLREVVDNLKEKGYNPVNQIVGYLMSGDPGYISSHREARSKIVKFDRTKILEIIIKRYLNK